MSLKAGNRLGPYEIVSLAGAGGMGEVYKAFDTRLDRTVAIKVLPAAFTGDAQFRERFDREARLISQLDHPHICALYDVGEATVSESAVRFLVIQYLEGTTLADRIAKGPLPLKEALSIAVQIADALDSAHRAGIVHRDLKPGNVMLTRSGAKLLDFGLATARGVANSTGLSMLPTTPPNLTAQGTILGTFQYMSPEQLEGKEADSRADLFAFGAVLYEMITGRKAFSGGSHASLISSIMSSHPPPVSTVMTLAPAALDQLIARCLAKDPEDRWQSARDVKLQLAWIAESPAAASAPVAAVHNSRERVAWGLAALMLVALLGSLAMRVTGGRDVRPAAEAVQFTVLPPDKTTFSADADAQALSPDGRQIVFVATGADGTPMLWIRRLDSLNARMLPGTDAGGQPFWSPDSRSIGFFASGKLKRIDVSSGSPQTLADAPFPLGGTWSAAGVILFGGSIGSPLFQVPAGGGPITPATSLVGGQRSVTHAAPHFLPDGRHFFFVAANGPTTGDLCVASLDSKDIKVLLQSNNSSGVYAPPGYLLFRRDSTLMAQTFDLDTLSVRGEAGAIAESIGTYFVANTYDASNTGSLVYRPSVTSQTRLTWVDRTGRPIGTSTPPGSYGEMALSADSKRVAFSRYGQDGHVWLTDLERGITSRLTFQGAFNNVPIWSPDGKQIVYASGREQGLDLYQRPSDSSGPERLLVKLSAQPIVFPSDWSADGRFIAYYRLDFKTQLDIWTLAMDAESKPVPYLRGDFNETQPQFSPDGRWIAYVSDESGARQVYVQSFPTLGGQRQISADGGSQPRWRRDGKELYFLAPDRKLMTVTVNTGATFESEAPRAMFQTTLNPGELRHVYAVSADGLRFLLNTPVETASPPLTVVLNWPALLKK